MAASNDVMQRPVVISHRPAGPNWSKHGIDAEIVFGTDQHLEEVIGTLLNGIVPVDVHGDATGAWL